MPLFLVSIWSGSDRLIFFLEQARGNSFFNNRFVDETSIRVATTKLPYNVALMLILIFDIKIRISEIVVKQTGVNDVFSKRLVVKVSIGMARLLFNMVPMLLITFDVERRCSQL